MWSIHRRNLINCPWGSTIIGLTRQRLQFNNFEYAGRTKENYWQRTERNQENDVWINREYQ